MTDKIYMNDKIHMNDNIYMNDKRQQDLYLIKILLSFVYLEYRTKTIYKCYKGTMANWDEQFSFTIPPGKQFKSGVFQLTLMDEDQFSADDFMGRIEIPLNKIDDETQWYNLTGQGKIFFYQLS